MRLPRRPARRAGPLAGLLLVLGLVGACSPSSAQERSGESPATLRGTELDVPAPAFTLTDQHGQPYDYAARTRGKAVLLFFGYTNCPDECPTTMATLATALRDSPPQVRQRTQVVFVSSDPERDTPARSAQWISAFGWPADSQAVALTGSIDTVYPQARRVGVPLDPPVHEPDGSVTVTHGAQVLGYDSTGASRVAWGEQARPSDVTHDLPLLVAPAPRTAPSRGTAGLGVFAGNPRAVPTADGGLAAYLVLQNASDRDDQLTAVSSPEARSVALRDSPTPLALPAGSSVELGPDGPHLLLGGLVAPLGPGAQVHLQLTFAHAGPVAVTARVAADAAPVPAHTHG